MRGNRYRAMRLAQAVRASIIGDSSVIENLYTLGVLGWSPTVQINSASELAGEFEFNGDAFTEVEVEVSLLDVNSPQACVEWEATAVHSGPIEAGNGITVAPTGRRVKLRGITVADFDDDRICSFRQYWDELSLLVELGLVRLAGEEGR